ncbi:hypothetical protein MVES1_003786 [Malassezia vespertilionis]|uniref:Vps72/YL1 C-terminal domain-containing protein n=1 Tax=Malassezia vespertilionis TaxID=2020962 RepID=A0A2N1J7J6_9BASI|nr:uncharacterized protein MVES1_003786 [Malassezia vespertilionis]PKI82537.1 hypothetical protein MVES_003342 [Malassezia vespertilionis]WFD08414.1 hypothetical protein MVES1_003786 [Malassezia vespertilionis]
MSEELLLHSRARRATAGNRMRELLEQQLEDEDTIFAEVENDVEFEQVVDEVDIVDSDFDGSSSEEDSAEDAEAEDRIEQEERRVRTSKKPRALPLHAIRPALAQPRPPKPTFDTKKRAPAARPVVLADGVRRSSSRSATVQSKMETMSKLREAEERRASARARPVKKRSKRLTQDMLIAEALEMEEGNTQSLQRFLHEEEERKVRQRASTKRGIVGPYMRWISVGMTPNTFFMRERREETRIGESEAAMEVEGEAADGSKSTETAAMEAQAPTPTPTPTDEQGIAEDVGRALPRDATHLAATVSGGAMHAETGSTTGAMSAGAPTAETAATATVPSVSLQETAAPMPAAAGQENAPPSHAIPPPDLHNTAPSAISNAPAHHADVKPASAHTDTHTPPMHLSPKDASAVPAAEIADPRDEEVAARTILSLHQLPPDAGWPDEFALLLGDHCTWDRLPVVPSRNRPFRPRQSTCVITGLAARYRDPVTGIPYATKEAFETLRRVQSNAFLWTGSDSHTTALAAGCYMAGVDDAGAGGIFQRCWEEKAVGKDRGEYSAT